MNIQQGDSNALSTSFLELGFLQKDRPDRSPDKTTDLENSWRTVEGFYRDAVSLSHAISHADVEDELLFCLLGGYGITEEHGRSAWETVRQLDPFSEAREDDDLFEILVATLEFPQFKPFRTDGSPRRYRFPRQKASVIVKAREWVCGRKPLDECLLYWDDPNDRRKILVECPGLGLKSASWLLRNLGMGAGLAILDVHLVRALQDAKRIGSDVRLPRDYYTVEKAFLRWCHELDAPSDAFDLFIWEWQRGTLRSG